jgi:hypothetical protein
VNCFLRGGREGEAEIEIEGDRDIEGQEGGTMSNYLNIVEWFE